MVSALLSKRHQISNGPRYPKHFYLPSPQKGTAGWMKDTLR